MPSVEERAIRAAKLYYELAQTVTQVITRADTELVELSKALADASHDDKPTLAELVTMYLCFRDGLLHMHGLLDTIASHFVVTGCDEFALEADHEDDEEVILGWANPLSAATIVAS